jgi:nucleoside-diphosphate-sugar epimerase
MQGRIFLAGASGVIGRRLTPLLVDAGYQVVGMGRSLARAAELKALGADYVAVDVFDADAVAQAIGAVRPDIVIHQLTDLPPRLDPSLMGEAVLRNARIREEGTRNLVTAARAAGVRKLIAQSIAWAYAPGALPYVEESPLDLGAQGNRAVTVKGVVVLESLILNSPPLEGVVLRYGNLYGPDTGREGPEGPSPLHVDAAAYAALCAVEHWRPGIFNIAEPQSEAAARKVIEMLHWRSDFRLEMKERAAL